MFPDFRTPIGCSRLNISDILSYFQKICNVCKVSDNFGGTFPSSFRFLRPFFGEQILFPSLDNKINIFGLAQRNWPSFTSVLKFGVVIPIRPSRRVFYWEEGNKVQSTKQRLRKCKVCWYFQSISHFYENISRLFLDLFLN
jgi:hypothetical protein